MIAELWTACPLADVFGVRDPGRAVPGLTEVGAGTHQIVAGVTASIGLALAGLWLAWRSGRGGKR